MPKSGSHRMLSRASATYECIHFCVYMPLHTYGTPALCISYVTFQHSKRSTFRRSKRSTFRRSKRTPDPPGPCWTWPGSAPKPPRPSPEPSPEPCWTWPGSAPAPPRPSPEPSREPCGTWPGSAPTPPRPSPEPSPEPCWRWPGSAPKPPRPSPEPSESSPEPRWTWPGACTSAHGALCTKASHTFSGTFGTFSGTSLNLTRRLHQCTPELFRAEDPISLCCWGIRDGNSSRESALESNQALQGRRMQEVAAAKNVLIKSLSG